MFSVLRCSQTMMRPSSTRNCQRNYYYGLFQILIIIINKKSQLCDVNGWCCRIFSFLDVVTLCRCAQVSRVSSSQMKSSFGWLLIFVLVWLTFLLLLLSRGTFWLWTEATGNASTCSTSRETSRSDIITSLFFYYYLLLSWWTNNVLCVCVCVLQGRVVENISKRCGGFLRKLSLRGCLGVGDSALR